MEFLAHYLKAIENISLQDKEHTYRPDLSLKLEKEIVKIKLV
ncbi:hypothetical protein [Helicobacter sp.]|nr:hypothetical protein [Helicobacter sp.]